MTINDNTQWQPIIEQQEEYELAVALDNEGVPTHAKFWVYDDGSPQSNDERCLGEAWAQQTLQDWNSVPKRILIINTRSAAQDMETGAITAPIEILWRTKLEVLIDCQQPIQPLSLVNAMSLWIANEFNWDDNPPLSIFTSTAQVGARQYSKMYRSPDETNFAVETGVSTLPPYRTPVLLEDIEPLLRFVEDAFVDAQQDNRFSDKLEALGILHEVYQAIAKAQEVPLEQICRQRSKDSFSIVPNDFNALTEDDD